MQTHTNTDALDSCGIALSYCSIQSVRTHTISPSILGINTATHFQCGYTVTPYSGRWGEDVRARKRTLGQLLSCTNHSKRSKLLEES